jgi:hypothetical protein
MPATPLLQELKIRGQEAFIRTIPAKYAPDEEKHGRLNAIEEIVFVGYPNGLYDKVNLLPIVRRGITATHPEINYEGQPVFLIDASVFPGSSGSPVFIINSGGYFDRGALVLGNRILFLGIVSRVFFREERGEIIQVPIAEMTTQFVRTREMIHLGVVYKASVVIETAKLYFAHWRGLVSAANESS